MRKLIPIAALTALAACQPAPPPAPPPPPPVVSIPRPPAPPLGASINTYIPPVRFDGMRETINRDIGPLETLWHVRTALNVAALGCTGPAYARITDDYNAFLNNNSSVLRNANDAILRKFQRDEGSGYRSIHDQHQTALYNYWSFSPVRRPFCDQALSVGQRAVTQSGGDLNAFAATALPELERPFNDFYLAYEQYERDLDAWRAKYAPEQLVDAKDETVNTTGLTGGLSEEAEETEGSAVIQQLPGGSQTVTDPSDGSQWQLSPDGPN